MGQLGYNHGDLGWTQLSTSDPVKALQFYRDLAGWESMGEPGEGYYVFGKGNEALGGITCCNEGEIVPRWMPYITVDDLDAALAKAESLGAKVILSPTPLPEDCGRVAIFEDPQGVATGLAQYAKKS
jgi:predicted enzyme related to lactoylglutathione lyase